MAISSDRAIPLRDGPTVPESVVLWMLNAEERGLWLRLEADDALRLGPSWRRTAEDLAFAKAHKSDLIACVKYCDDMARRPL